MKLRTLPLLALSCLVLAGCDKLSDAEPDTMPSDTGADTDTATDAPPVVYDDEIELDVIYASTPESAALTLAMEDVVAAWTTIRGATTTESHVLGDPALADARNQVVVRVAPETETTLGTEGYRFTRDAGADVTTLTVLASTEIGAAYGLWDLAQRMGVRYLHPEESWFPSDDALALPEVPGDDRVPDFIERGFHEHTQHPLPFADYYMIADDAHRAPMTNYFQWLARNRQNRASFMLLKTLDKPTWAPWMAELVAEANALGIEVGAVASFADQQQNGFKLIEDDTQSDDVWIAQNLDLLLGDAGFDFLTLQIGTSEFTKPTDVRTLAWLDTALAHTRDNYPEVELANWIHIACDVEADGGGLFYHLPLQADPAWTAWVHTTMYYTLDSPAPVYECDDFTHQIDFMNEADPTERRQIFFPETAWWLGFDNNMPVALPITGWSRAYDIQQVLPNHDVSGHITFTSGREWGYWKYDHYLTQVTWEADLTWDEYLAWLAPIYGENEAVTRDAIIAFTALQVEHFYERNPLIYFYVAGELAQDELGEQAGILARRPKLSYRKVYDYDEAEFAEWQANDLDLLYEMADAYETVVATLPAATDEHLYRELRHAFELFTIRLRHAIELYEGVIDTRTWRLERALAIVEAREPSEAIRTETLASAQAHLAAAEAFSAEAAALILEGEAGYRYPLDLLTTRRNNLTSYKFGYLEQTHTAHFWHRRDEQLDRHITFAFDESDDAWITDPDLLFETDGTRTTMLVPDDIVAGTAIASFVPRLLFGLTDFDPVGGTMGVLIGEDYNENFLPDENTEQRIDGAISTDGSEWTGSASIFSLVVRDGTGAVTGTLAVQTPQFTLSLQGDGANISDVTSGALEGEVIADDLLGLIQSVGGIDEEGASNLLKGVYDVPDGEPLPERLPVHFRFRFDPV